MPTVFSTRDVHPRDSLSYWIDVVTREFVKLALKVGNDFKAQVIAGSIGSLDIATYEVDAHDITRGAREISRADNDNYFICLQRSGRSIHMQGDRLAVTEKGTFFLGDPRHQFSARVDERGQVVIVQIPREELEARTGPAAALTARTLDSGHPVAGLAYGFLSMLPDRIDTLTGAAAAKVVDQALDLVALALTAETQASGLALSSPRATALTLLKSAIEARLHDPELKPAMAAAAAGISVRYANALLAEENTGLERYIIARRLERCRRALEDPAQARRMVGDIAYCWGFSDLSHFGRRFKAEFGCSPGEYRRRQRALIPAGE